MRGGRVGLEKWNDLKGRDEHGLVVLRTRDELHRADCELDVMTDVTSF